LPMRDPVNAECLEVYGSAVLGRGFQLARALAISSAPAERGTSTTGYRSLAGVPADLARRER
jgi:hypothetical protein